MSRRVKRKVTRSKGKDKATDSDEYVAVIDAAAGEFGGGDDSGAASVDWTSLPDDTMVGLFSRLSYRDRASLSSTCWAYRLLGSSQCLWSHLDLRAHRLDADVASSLAPRCVTSLRRVRFRGSDSAAALIHLRARNLCHVSGDSCRDLSDAVLSVLAARHEALETLQIGPDACDRFTLTGDSVHLIASCCPRLKNLRLSSVRDIDGNAISALAKHCPSLDEISFTDCLNIDQSAFGNICSLRFLSLSGSKGIDWASAVLSWSNLPNLLAIDMSRTDISPSTVSRLLSLSKSIRVICAFNCSVLEVEGNHNPLTFSSKKGKLVLAFFTDIFKGIASLFSDSGIKEKNVFGEWRSLEKKDRIVSDIMCWIEWVLSLSLLRIAETNPHGIDEFWLNQGAGLLLSLGKSSQEEVQERAATSLATFVVTDEENATVDPARAEAVMKNEGVSLLLELARSGREGVQSEAAKAIANLSVNSKVAKAVAAEGGILILAELARSMNKLVAEEAAGGLWNLSVGEEHKAAIAAAGGIKALVDLIYKWPSGTDGVLERAAGALANLAADDKCSMEVALAGGVHALVTLTRSCKVDGVQEQAARALANLAAHGDSNGNNAAIGQEAGALEALVQLTRSHNEGVRQEAAGALWNLSFDDRNREAIAAGGGVEALVALAQACSNASQGLQERAAGALWGLSVSEANSIAIGREGGVAPLISLARSDSEDVHETAAGALWNLAFNSGNALRIVEEGGVPALVHLCSSSGSKMARFMAALALAYMFDGRMDEVALIGSSSEGTSKSINFDGARRIALKHIDAFVLSFSDPQIFSAAVASSSPAPLAQVVEAARIQEAGHLRCSGAEIGRFVIMLKNSSSILRACAAFALLQFTIPGGRHAMHHAGLLKDTGAARVLRGTAASATATIEAKLFARVVLRSLEHHQLESSA